MRAATSTNKDETLEGIKRRASESEAMTNSGHVLSRFFLLCSITNSHALQLTNSPKFSGSRGALL